MKKNSNMLISAGLFVSFCGFVLYEIKSMKEAKKQDDAEFDKSCYEAYGAISEVIASLRLVHGKEFKEEIKELERIRETLNSVKTWKELTSVFESGSKIMEAIHNELNNGSSDGA